MEIFFNKISLIYTNSYDASYNINTRLKFFKTEKRVGLKRHVKPHLIYFSYNRMELDDTKIHKWSIIQAIVVHTLYKSRLYVICKITQQRKFLSLNVKKKETRTRVIVGRDEYFFVIKYDDWSVFRSHVCRRIKNKFFFFNCFEAFFM
jgi:hypothetical protein